MAAPKIRVVGAGLPRTGTQSLRVALERLIGGRCCHMSVIEGHPFDLGPTWARAFDGDASMFAHLLDGFTAAVDWPASAFWRELSEVHPDAIVLLSTRDSARTWFESCDATFLPYARMSLASDWTMGRDLARLLERFTGTKAWNDPNVLMAAYDRHNDAVRRSTPKHRLLDWRAEDGWAPICSALDVAAPAEPFPWTNRRSEWK
jgi:hypothetical protein